MDIQPVRNDDEHRKALQEIERLWNADPDSEDGIKLDLLVTLVERYEARRWPVDTAQIDPVEMLNWCITEGGRSQTELAELLGSRSRASEVLGRKRALTVEMIHKISENWKIPASLLVKPYRLDTAA